MDFLFPRKRVIASGSIATVPARRGRGGWSGAMVSATETLTTVEAHNAEQLTRLAEPKKQPIPGRKSYEIWAGKRY